MIKTIIVVLLGALGAGLTTGFAGLSAAVYITPMLTAFLGISFYDSVGVALASDVLASAVSAFTYYKKGNIDLKHGKPLMFTVWIAAVLGSVVAYFISYGSLGNSVMGWWSVIGAFIIGVDLLIRANKERKKLSLGYSRKHMAVIVLCGAYIGFVCGFQGTGGGIMLLLALTVVMSFEFKTAVGTSVFIMTLTALIGAISHFAINGFPDFDILILSVIATTVFARLGAIIANRLPAPKLKRITGIILTVSAIILFIVKIA